MMVLRAPSGDTGPTRTGARSAPAGTAGSRKSATQYATVHGHSVVSPAQDFTFKLTHSLAAAALPRTCPLVRRGGTVGGTRVLRLGDSAEWFADGRHGHAPVMRSTARRDWRRCRRCALCVDCGG